MHKVLVVDDQPSVCTALEVLFDLHGLQTLSARSPEDALAAIEQEDIGVVVQDMNFRQGTTSGTEGVELMRAIRRIDPDVPIVLMTAFTSLEMAVKLIKEGANDYIAKPWDDSKLVATIKNLMRMAELQQENTRLVAQGRRAREELARRYDLCGLVYGSPQMHEVVSLAVKVAGANVPVLITGPNGCGKEKVADIVQANSRRKDKPYVKVNSGGLPDNLVDAELFGAEAGAYTGASRTRVGRFDLGSHFVMARLVRALPPDDLIGCFVAYNFWELGSQPFFGLLVDRIPRPRTMALLGLAVLSAGLLFPTHLPWFAMTLSGVGNTLFHVGMGVIAMRATPFSAAGPGLFIAPGAIGVAIARTWGADLLFPLWPVVLLLLLPVALLIGLVPDRAVPPTQTPEASRTPAWLLFAVGLLMVAVGLRSLVGLRVGAAFGASATWMLPLAVATLAGKGLGGLAADRIGFRTTAVATLAGSALLFLVATENLGLAMLAILLFQSLTGVTLAALWRLMPGRPGLAFGLNCTALFFGSLPVVTRQALPPDLGIDAALCLVAALAIWAALTPRQRVPQPAGAS